MDRDPATRTEATALVAVVAEVVGEADVVHLLRLLRETFREQHHRGVRREEVSYPPLSRRQTIRPQIRGQAETLSILVAYVNTSGVWQHH
jgi:hypothetical protein